MYRLHTSSLFFFFNDTATTEIYTLSLHDALPISPGCAAVSWLTRQHEGSEVWAGEFARRLEEKRQRLARFFWQDDRVHEPAGGGESGVELMLVIHAHRVDRGREIGRASCRERV